MSKSHSTLVVLVAALSVSLLLKTRAADTSLEAADSSITLNKSAPTRPALKGTSAKLPISFERNEGQTDRKVKFISRGSRYSLFLTSDEAVLALMPPAQDDGKQPLEPRHLHDSDSQQQLDVIRMKLLGANPSAQVSGTDKLGGTTNYFIGNNPAKWRTDVPLYSRVHYRNVYPGIDLLYHGDGGQLEYDFIVAPGADPNSIRLDYGGTTEIQIDCDGNLILRTGSGEVVQKSPLIYQQEDQGRKEVAGRFVLRSPKQVGFEVDTYDRSKTLVIDPILVYSTYLGGGATDIGYSVATDAQGNAYVTGSTVSTNFPTSNPFRSANSGSTDVVITKLNPTGTALIYSTYIGGSDADGGYAIALNSDAEAYITGFTHSTNFPMVGALQPIYGGGTFDAFLLRLNSTGDSLIYSTYAGGSGEDVGNGIALDSSRNIYGIGYTSSNNLTTVNPIQPFNGGGYDAYAIEVSPSGNSIIFSTYAGGSGTDAGNAITVDSLGFVYAVGDTTSINLNTLNALQTFNAGGKDAFLAKLTPSGTSRVFSTYAGGNGDDSGQGIALDGFGNIYAVGYTNSTNLAMIVNAVQPTKAAGYDAFISKLSPNGTAILYSTFLGGNNTDAGYGIATDSVGNAYVIGQTFSTDFPLMSPLRSTYGGAGDVFVSKLWPSGSTILFSSYLGGSGEDLGFSIAADDSGNVYLTGRTASTNFSMANPFQPSAGGGLDFFISKIMTGTPTPGPKIAFASSRNGDNHDIYIMDPDGSNQIRLTSNLAYEDQPKWSPDASKIAFMSKRDGNFEIYSMKGDGTNQTRLTNNLAADGFPAWSPDGTKIAFVSGDLRDPTTFEIYVMNADGSNRSRLTNDTLIDGVPAWSPDGTKIVFMSGSTSLFDPNSYEIYVINADGTNRTRLTNNSVVDGQPSFSPDGSKILFASGNAFNAAGIEIYTMNSDGTERMQLTSNSLADAFPAWSPDGAKIVFASGGTRSSPLNPFDETIVELYVMNADGSNRIKLTNNSSLEWFPNWGVAATATPTPTPTPTPGPTPQWQPIVLEGQHVVELKAWTVGGRTFVYVKPQFPDAGYRIANWRQVGRIGNVFTVDASVERFNGSSIQAVVTTANIYDLGPLVNGTYSFNFKTSGTLAKSLQFTVSSDVPPPNPIDNARQFVKQQYRDFLNRETDQAGEDFWTDNITKCSDPARRPAGQTEAQCTLRQRETTSGAFFLSPEFQYTGGYVYRIYQGALGRQPKLSEFLPDAQAVGNGIVVNGQLSAAKINQNKADFAAQFINCNDPARYRCSEFKAIYDVLNNQQYVDKLFQTTGVNASALDRTALVDGLNGGTETRGTVLQKVVDGINVISEGNQQFTTTYGQAFYDQQFTRAFVQLEYFGYMKRDPDEAGYAFWLGKLNQFGGNFVNAEMVLAFISSPEYRARFGQP